MTPDHLTPAETAKQLGLKSAGTLANWRAQGRGPRYVKHGRRVLYPVAAIEVYKRESFTAQPSTAVLAGPGKARKPLG